MTERQARALFERTCEKLHQAGWDVVGVISRAHPHGNELSTRILVHGETPRAKEDTYRALVEHVANMQNVPRPRAGELPNAGTLDNSKG